MEHDTPINKTLDENSTMQYKAQKAEQEEFESEQAKTEGLESMKRKAITQSVMKSQSQYNKALAETTKYR